MFFEELLSLVDVFLVYEGDFGIIDNFLSEEMAKPVVGSVPENGSGSEQETEDPNIKRAKSSNGSGSKEK